jgi:undecaprenyl-diphosphatase
VRDLIYAILLGIVEGVTEFLPISSTGHLALCQQWMGIDLENDPFWRTFAVFIQIGAIIAVLVYFWDRILTLIARRPTPATPLEIATASSQRTLHPVWLVAIASAPVFVIGFLAQNYVEEHLANPLVIASALGIGGVLMILIEVLRGPVRTERLEEMTLRQALFIGFAQVLAAIFPGTSRSAATIMGGLVVGLQRSVAAEFSFFLAIPSMFAACGYSLLKLFLAHPDLIGLKELLLLAVGTLVSFLVAWVVIAGFMSYIRRYSFIPFAIYRIILGLIVFAVLL